jgi:hypothetical protein
MIDRINWSLARTSGLANYFSRNQPVVIVGVDHSLALMEWSLERLVNEYGDIVIRVLRSETQYFVYNEKRERTVLQMSLADFYSKGVLRPGSDGFYYTLGRSPIDQFLGFEAYMRLPLVLSRIVDGILRRPERNIWISPQGTRTALHFDAVENLNLQIEGSKSFLLYPPKIDGMHACRWSSQAAYVSSVDPRKNHGIVDFPYADGLEVVLEKGEMLYLPYGWWHQVDTVGETNLNANYWWFPRTKLLAFPNQTLRGAAVLINRMGQHPHRRAERQKVAPV